MALQTRFEERGLISDFNQAINVAERPFATETAMISPRASTRSDQQHYITLFSSITSRAVSLSLAHEEVDLYNSLQLFELGRGIIANKYLEVRSDVSWLAEHDSNLALRFRYVQEQIDSPTLMFDSESTIIDDSHSLSNSTSTLDFSKHVTRR